MDGWDDEDDWDKEDDWDMGGNIADEDFAADYSATSYYPDPYCGRVTALKTECFQESILELWANKGVFDETSEREIKSLTKEKIIDKL